MAQCIEELGDSGKYAERALTGKLQENFLLSFPERVTVAFRSLLTQDRRNQLVPAFADLDFDPLGRHFVAQALESPAPRLDVRGVGVDERAVDVEDDAA